MRQPKFFKSAYDLKLEEQARIDRAKRKKAKYDATPEGAKFKADCEEWAAEMRRAWMAIEHCRKTLKRTGQLKLEILGARAYCEAADGKAHDDVMAERRALGTALDLLAPTSLASPQTPGAGRWGAIWGERRNVPCQPPQGLPDAAVAFLPLDTWSSDRMAVLAKAGVPIYEVKLK